MSALRLIAILPLLVAAMGASCQTRPTVPKVVEVIVERTVAVPEDLTRPCHIEPAKNQSFGEAVRLRKVDKASLQECSDRMRQIRELKR